MAAIPVDLLDRIRRLERTVRELGGRVNIRKALNEVLNGTVLIGDGGSLDVRSPSDVQILGVGEFPATGRYGVASAREDGTGLAFQIGGNGLDAKQMIRIFARVVEGDTDGIGNVIVMEDGYADGFLGRPWVPIPMAPPVEFTNASWETKFLGRWRVQHAVLESRLSLFAPTATTAEARLAVNIDGTVIPLGDTVVATNNVETFSTQRITPGEHGQQHAAVRPVLVQVQRTAGAGTCEVWCHGVWGVHTLDATEADA